jgi:outer membrane protein assembly factor BamB
MNRLFLNIFVSLLLVAMNLPIYAQLDPTPKGFRLLWKIPAYSCFSRLEVIRQTDSGAAFINARTMSCETGQSIGELGIWVDSKGNAVYMNARRGPDNQDIIYFSEDRIVFADGSGLGTIGGPVNNTLKITEVVRSGANATTNISSFGESAFVPNLYYEPANPKDRIILNLASNQQWSPFRWLYAYTVDSGAGSGGETGSGLSQYIKIKNDPVDQYGILGGSVEFKVDVLSSIPVTYQWQKDGKDLAGAALTNLRVDKIATINNGVYTLIVKSALGIVTSSPAKLQVVALPIVTFATNRVSGEYGKVTILAPTVISQGPTVYRWFKDGVPLIQEEGDSINIDFASKSGSYYVECKNLAGLVTSKSVTFVPATIPPGSKRWDFQTGHIIYSSPGIGSDGTVYFGGYDGKVYALNGLTGVKKWEVQTGSGVNSSPAIGSDGTVYIGSYDGMVYALNGANGVKKWEFQTGGGGGVGSSPAIGSDGSVYVGCFDTKVYALNGATGVRKWEFQTGAEVFSSPAIRSDGTVYVGSRDSKLYALDGGTGAKKWEFQTGREVDSSPAIGSDGTVYIGSKDGKVYALNGSTGVKKWEVQTGSDVNSSPAIGSDGTVYIGSYDGMVYALNGANGVKKWEVQTGSGVRSSPAIGSDGTVYVGSLDNKLYALNGTTGVKKWTFQTESGVDSSPAIGSDGTIYIGSYDRKMYAILSESLGLAKSPWSKFHANNQNTGKIASGFGPMTINYSPQSGLNLDIPVSPDFDTILEYSTNLNQWSEQQRFGRQSGVPSIVVPLKMDQTKSMEYWRTRNQ